MVPVFWKFGFLSCELLMQGAEPKCFPALNNFPPQKPTSLDEISNKLEQDIIREVTFLEWQYRQHRRLQLLDFIRKCVKKSSHMGIFLLSSTFSFSSWIVNLSIFPLCTLPQINESGEQNLIAI